MVPKMIDSTKMRRQQDTKCRSPSNEIVLRPEMQRRLSIISTISSEAESQESLSESSVRAFLTDYFDDLYSLSGTSFECWWAFYSKNHSTKYNQIQPTGNTIRCNEFLRMYASGEAKLRQSSLVSIDSVIILSGGMSAAVTYTLEDSLVNHGEEKRQRAIVTAIVEMIHGEVRLVQEHRSKGFPLPTATRWSSMETAELRNFNRLPNRTEKTFQDTIVPLKAPSSPSKAVRDSIISLKEPSPQKRNAPKTIQLPKSKHQEISTSRWSQDMARIDSDIIMKAPSRHRRSKSFEYQPKVESETICTRGSFHDCKRRGSSDRLLSKPRRSKSLAVSSEVLACIAKKGSSDRISHVQAHQPSENQTPSKQSNATWGTPKQPERFAALSPGVRTRLRMGMGLIR